MKHPKIANYQTVFREFPDEITLAFNFSSCPFRCKNCHSQYLAEDIGEESTLEYIDSIIDKHPESTCIGLMGGDADPDWISRIALHIHHKYPALHIGWYSGRTWNRHSEDVPVNAFLFDYIKFGQYIEELGGLDNPNTNQRMYHNTVHNNDICNWEDITYKFQKKSY